MNFSSEKRRTMNHQKLILILLTILFFAGCHSGKKSDEVARYAYDEKSGVNHEWNKKIGEWLTVDAVCYGLVVNVDKEGNPKFGKSVKAKVVELTKEGVKMKALETVRLVEAKGNNVIGITKGQIWLETDGELFLTKEKADAYLNENNLLKE